MNRKTLLALALVVSLGRASAHAQSEMENKMREQLRNTMLQLRSVQNDKAALEAKATENEEKVKTLTTQVDSLTKQATEFEKTATNQADEIAKYKEAIEKWKIAYEECNTVATAKEAERAKLADKSIVLDRRVADLERKNSELFRLGNEILRRYERFSLGDALAAKEPFTGLAKVKLENLVQGYDDKLSEQKSHR